MTTPTPTPPDAERPDAPPATATPADGVANAAPEPEIGDRWRTFPTPERRAELDARLAAWAVMPEHGTLLGPFDLDGWDDMLTGADVYYLAARSLVGPGGDIAEELAQLRGDPSVMLPHLHLEHAVLRGAQLEHAHLFGAHLEHAVLSEAHLEHAVLSGASFDGETDLSDASLGAARWWERFVPWSKPTTAALGDIHWGGVGTVDLTRIVGNWEGVERLGDERDLSWRDGAEAHASVVQAYRQVATQLRAQGLNEPAGRFAYRAHVLNRGVLLRRALRNPLRLPQYLGSWLLALLAGYGFRPGRTLLCYLATPAFFVYAYIQVTHGLPIVPPLGPLAPHGLLRFGTSASIPPLPPSEALILSVSSFHGRGFFQPLKSLGDPVAGLAAVEAIIGLLIEVSFIATFTQRFFGK